MEIRVRADGPRFEFVERLISGSTRRAWNGYWRVQYRRLRRRYEVDPSFEFSGHGISLFGDGRIVLGPDSYLAEWAAVCAVEGTLVRIGQNCSVGQYTRIYSGTRRVSAHLRGARDLRTGDVRIGDGVWLGMNVFVGPGVTIGDRSVVGANCVVTRDVAAGTVVRALSEISST